MNFSREFIESLKQAEKLTNTMFHHNQQDISFGFSVYPTPSPRIKNLWFSVNEKSLHYSNGPQEWYKFKWTGRQDQPVTFLQAANVYQNKSHYLEEKGVWGFFRLLSKAKLVRENNGIIRAVWKIKQGKSTIQVILKFRSEQGFNLIETLLLKQFFLPTTIVFE